MPRSLPSAAEAAEILARRRTRPVRRPPPVAGKGLTKFLKTLEDRFGDAGPGPRLLAQRWREVVGELLARRTAPLKLSRPRRGGPASLEIKVDGAASTLIQHQAPEILARVNLLLGAGSVDRLRIVQGPVKPPAVAAPAPKRTRADQPLDAAAEAELARSLDGAPEGALKSALLRLGREVARKS